MFWKKKPYILVIDDSADVRLILSDMLQSRGYEVSCAKDAPEALKLAHESPPILFLVDIMLPGTDGFSLLEAFKDHPKLKDVPALMISALQQAKDVERAFSIGAAGYIIKPFTAERVAAKVKEALGRGAGQP